MYVPNDYAFGMSVRVVPRFAVREVFSDSVTNKLADSDALLRSYVGLPKVLLGSCADQAEDALFNWVSQASPRDDHRRLTNGLVLIGTDPEYKWVDGTRGHYYVAQGDSSRDRVRRVQERVAARHSAVVNRLGAASRGAIDSAVTDLRESLDRKRAYDAQEPADSVEASITES